MSIIRHYFKRIGLALLGMGLLSVGALSANEIPPGAGSDTFWPQMLQMRNLMHYGVFTATPLDNGIQVNITGTEAALVETIQQKFIAGGYNNSTPYPDTLLTVTALSDGVSLVFTSDSPRAVQQLKNAGTASAHGLLQNAMHAQMHAGQTGYGRMGGHGMGWGHGHGPGTGMMAPGGPMWQGWGVPESREN